MSKSFKMKWANQNYGIGINWKGRGSPCCIVSLVLPMSLIYNSSLTKNFPKSQYMYDVFSSAVTNLWNFSHQSLMSVPCCQCDSRWSTVIQKSCHCTDVNTLELFDVTGACFQCESSWSTVTRESGGLGSWLGIGGRQEDQEGRIAQ